MEDNKLKLISRFTFLKQATVSTTGLAVAPLSIFGTPRSNDNVNRKTINGVMIGVNAPYSYRELSSANAEDAEELIDLLVDTGFGGVELRSDVVESYARAPQTDRYIGEPTEEEIAQQKELKNWRKSATMEPIRELRQKYNDEGVQVYALRHNAWSVDMPEWELDYVFNVAKAIGANHVTMEMPREDDGKLTDLVGKFAAKHELLVGYHNHPATFHFWDRAIWQSEYNGLCLDVGHYYASTGESPIPLMEKYWDRIGSLHLKDRKLNGTNMPFGEGETPLVEILQLMKERKAKFAATIELEYDIPENSNTKQELVKCLEFCRRALA